MNRVPADSIAEQAAHWIVQLSADDEHTRASARAGFAAWKAQDPLHARAAASMESLLGQVHAVRGPSAGDTRPARAALAAVAPKRRRHLAAGVAAAMLVVAVAVAGFAASDRPAWLLADLRSPTGQWRTHTLADGSQLTLSSGTAVNVRFTKGERHVQLVQGEILVEVAKDAHRPFFVDSRQAALRALGTRFTVRQQDDATILSMLESKVAVQLPRHTDTVVAAGQRTRITAAGAGPLEPFDAASLHDAWRAHQLVVDDRPLPEVLDELARHRPGQLRYDRAQLDHIRVAAVLPLDDTDQALQLLLDNFPQLRVRMLTRYLVMVDAPVRNPQKK